MAKFSYTARNKAGKILKGKMDASNQREVAETLKKDGFWLTGVREIKRKKKVGSSFMDRFAKVPLKNRMIFCRHLAVMIGSGLTLSKALTILSVQEKNKVLKTVCGKLAADVKRGISFADALEKFPNVFNSIFFSMVRMGEVSGSLEEVLNILSNQLEKDHKLLSKIRGAMVYPAIIIIVMFVIGILMMTFVLPKITKIFEDFDAELPIMTQIIISTSHFMADNSWKVVGGMVITIIGICFFMKTAIGIRIFHKFYIKVPIFGSIVVKVNSARFSRILSSLLKSGTSLVDSLRITSETLGNYYFKRAVLQASKEVQKGVTLSSILERHNNIFPYLVVQMIGVGEETGKTDAVLLKLAQFYEDEVDQITKNLSSIIEPVLMVIIGAAVGFFAISIISPIYSIMDSM
ncbi:MAG: type II secretion system F family protein [Patescibacteria group bacterium]|nr:type II secretion system F family protein [Patescibacteria group bacterium]